jgi:hypothetical protein
MNCLGFPSCRDTQAYDLVRKSTSLQAIYQNTTSWMEATSTLTTPGIQGHGEPAQASRCQIRDFRSRSLLDIQKIHSAKLVPRPGPPTGFIPAGNARLLPYAWNATLGNHLRETGKVTDLPGKAGFPLQPDAGGDAGLCHDPFWPISPDDRIGTRAARLHPINGGIHVTQRIRVTGFAEWRDCEGGENLKSERSFFSCHPERSEGSPLAPCISSRNVTPR